MRPVPIRSYPSRYLATVRPFALLVHQVLDGTFTSSKNTSLTSWLPSRRTIGRTVMPGAFMSMSRNEMPSWRLPVFGSVLTRQKIQSA